MTTTHPALVRLNAEWRQLAESTPPPDWLAESCLARCRVLADVLAAVRSSPDEVLSTLLRLGLDGQVLAQRVVLQAFLPRIVLDAAADRTHDFDEYLSELWLGIASYPLTRRPSRIAGNLTMDVRKRVRQRSHHQPVDPGRLVALPEISLEPVVDLDGVLAEACRARLIDRDAAELLRLVYSRGLRSDRAGALVGLSAAAVRQRCHRAVRRLATHADQLADAVCG